MGEVVFFIGNVQCVITERNWSIKETEMLQTCLKNITPPACVVGSFYRMVISVSGAFWGCLENNQCMLRQCSCCAPVSFYCKSNNGSTILGKLNAAWSIILLLKKMAIKQNACVILLLLNVLYIHCICH